MRRLFLPVLAVVLFAPALHADQIPLGLRWATVFVQEYWANGKLYYTVFNKGDKRIQVTVIGTEGRVAGPWDVRPGSARQAHAEFAGGKGLIRFAADGNSLGLLERPPVPPEQARGKYLTFEGLNGSGGRGKDVWLQQDRLLYSGGDVIELRLFIPANRGQARFKKEATRLPLPAAPLIDAKCDTLPVKQEGQAVIIDSNQPLKAQDFHEVVLRFRAPEVQARTMAVIDGWLSQGKGGRGLTRGVMVLPK